MLLLSTLTISVVYRRKVSVHLYTVIYLSHSALLLIFSNETQVSFFGFVFADTVLA